MSEAKYGISLKAQIFVLLSGHYCQDDGSCQCGWTATGKQYPENRHPAHLAEIIEREFLVLERPLHREAR